jgi:hypothetical protein
MLSGMDMPWPVLGVVLGVLLVLLAGLAAALVLRRRDGDAGPDLREDDLPGFLESPPGSGAAAAHTGWAVLSAPAPPASPPRPRRRDAVVVLTVMAVTALLLVGVAAAVAAGSRHDGGRGHAERPEAAITRQTARLTFGGVVLEPRAVGVTATYPVVEVTTDGERSSARVEFPTFNCLTAEAPVDPVAAGCTASMTEYAELSSPDLVVDRDGDDLRISGLFPTELRPNGSAPTPTGRAYDLRITVTPAGEGRGSQPADGVLELGSDRAVTTEGEIRSGS